MGGGGKSRAARSGKLIDLDLPTGVFLMSIFPIAIGQVEGIAVSRQGKLLHGLWIEERADGRGAYYWLRFGRQSSGPVEERTSRP